MYCLFLARQELMNALLDPSDSLHFQIAGGFFLVHLWVSRSNWSPCGVYLCFTERFEVNIKARKLDINHKFSTYITCSCQRRLQIVRLDFVTKRISLAWLDSHGPCPPGCGHRLRDYKQVGSWLERFRTVERLPYALPVPFVWYFDRHFDRPKRI